MCCKLGCQEHGAQAAAIYVWLTASCCCTALHCFALQIYVDLEGKVLVTGDGNYATSAQECCSKCMETKVRQAASLPT